MLNPIVSCAVLTRAHRGEATVHVPGAGLGGPTLGRRIPSKRDLRQASVPLVSFCAYYAYCASVCPLLDVFSFLSFFINFHSVCTPSPSQGESVGSPRSFSVSVPLHVQLWFRDFVPYSL